MLKQTTVEHIRRRHIPRGSTHIVVTMCFHPRGLKKELRDEYSGELAPDEPLFKEWQAFEAEFGHELAFMKSDYENRFTLSPKALHRLKELSEMSNERDVYFVCKCRVGERCHREMLMLTAQSLFGAKTSKVFNQYPNYVKRLETLKSDWRES